MKETLQQYVAILNSCGYSHAAIARMIETSRATVGKIASGDCSTSWVLGETLRQKARTVAKRRMDELSEFLKKELVND